MTNYNDGSWHGWNGGECPVHPETVVKWKHEADYGSTDRAGDLEWSKLMSGLVAFRVVKEHKEPREFFVNKYNDKVTTSVPDYYDRKDYIHVREVME